MSKSFERFEKVTRRAGSVGVIPHTEGPRVHPFDERNIHPDIAKVSLKLFDDGHYSQATFEAFKLLDNTVKAVSGINESGQKLMMTAFNEANPKIKLTDLVTASDIDEQSGFRFMFARSMSAIRNPRGHDIRADPLGTCLDHLSVASVLLRRFEERKWPWFSPLTIYEWQRSSDSTIVCHFQEGRACQSSRHIYE